MKTKTIVTISGIRPDFIRMSEVFKRLDSCRDINHILIHTGQHYDKMLSDVFFDELNIRKPDYNLEIGGPGKEHFHQAAEITVKVIELFRKEKFKPDLILFLGDSNSVTCAMSLRKEGYKIGHIEAGMRSYDKKMLEEINRTVCDHCSNYHFVYHENYKNNLVKENLDENNIFVVGNTIVEVVKPFAIEIKKIKKLSNQFILDIHRPENFLYKERLQNILLTANSLSNIEEIPCKMLKFNRTLKAIEEFKLDLDRIELVDLMSYKNYLKEVYNSRFIISDSGTAQEEPVFLDTPVIVPRDYTERPESVRANNSIMFNVNGLYNDPIIENEDVSTNIDDIIDYLVSYHTGRFCYSKEEFIIDKYWLGDGLTSYGILNYILENVK